MLEINHFLKFLVVGTIGFIINTVVLVFGVRLGLKPSISGPLGGEIAILSNFVFNNFWTFSDKSITSWSVLPEKFIQFNVLSFGSVVIQFIFLKVGEKTFGLQNFKEPLVELEYFKTLSLVKLVRKIKILDKILLKLTTYIVFYIFGVGVGLIVNFISYSQIIWR